MSTRGLLAGRAVGTLRSSSAGRTSLPGLYSHHLAKRPNTNNPSAHS